MRLRKLPLLVAAVMAMSTLVACGSDEPPATSEECGVLDRVRYGLTGTTVSLGAVAYMQVPELMGFFAEECIDLQVTQIPAYSAGAAGALQAGLADAAVISPANAVQAVAMGSTEKVVYFTAYVNLIAYVLPTSKVKSFADFRGAKVGVADLGTSALNYCKLAALRAGVQEDEYEIIAAGQEMASAAESVRSGRVDVWCGTDVHGATFQNAGMTVNILESDVDAELLPGGSLVVTENFLKNKRDVVRRLIRALMKGYAWALANPEAAAFLALKYDPKNAPAADTKKGQVQQTAVIVKNRLDRSTPIGYPDSIGLGDQSDSALQRGVDIAVETGQIESNMPLSNWADLSITREVWQELDLAPYTEQGRNFQIPEDYDYEK